MNIGKINQRSRLPDPLDSLSHTNVVRLELVQSNCNRQGHDAKKPVERLLGLGQTFCGDIIGDASPIFQRRKEKSIALELKCFSSTKPNLNP